jgi:alanine racemase
LGIAALVTAMSPTSALSSWLEVDARALAHNARTLKARLREKGSDKSRLGVVVKANAYGHGLAQCAPALVLGGADWLIVDHASEATEVRAVAGLADIPLYVCGPTFPHDAQRLVDARARVVVYDAEQVQAFAAASRAAGVLTPLHLKIETGTHRQGLELPDALALAARIEDTDGVFLEGIATHFADIEDTTDHRYADTQREALFSAKRVLVEAGHGVEIVHAANSAATLIDDSTHGDLVRAGIASYGLWPSKETFASWQERHVGRPVPTLEPALSWRARLAQVKDVPAGAYVGYGRTYRTTRASRIAIVPVGYHEGYDRRLSNVAHVLVRGVRAPVRGRVCMNMIMVDVTDAPGARAGDTATLLGADGDERISAEQLASWMGSIHYEVVARLHPSQPRIVR